jgi:hypothetical protein
VETSDTGIDQCIKITCLICSPGFCKYFLEAVTDKYKWIIDPFHGDSPQNYDFSPEEGNYIDISDIPLKVSYLGSHI